MAKLEIKVGASADRSLELAFRPILEGAKRARAAVESEGKKAGRAIATETRKGTKDAEARFRELEAEISRGMPRAMSVGTKAVVDFSRETKRNFDATKREFQELAREADKNLNHIQRSSRQLGGALFERAGGSKGVAAGLSRSGAIAMGVGRAGAGLASRVVGDLARGAGVDLDLGSMFRKNTNLEATATQLSNSGYIAGDKRNGARVDPRDLMNQAMSVSKATGTDANDALEGLVKFAGLTGDLQTGRDILKDMAVLAKASGSSLEDMVGAAGEVATALGDVQDKGAQVQALMRVFAGQGKLGAVEIKDLARYMAKVASSAQQIEGKPAENIALLGAFAQKARQLGGASSAAGAADSVAALINTFKTPARANAFHAATKKSVYGDGGMIRNPEELVIEALRAKGMDPMGLKKIFGNVKGAQAIEGFATTYRQAGGGEAGEKAVREEFERLKRAAMQDVEVLDSFQAAMRTSQSQAEVFNTSLRESAMRVQDTLTPALLNAAPALLEMANAGAKFASWVVGNEALLRAQATAVDQNVKGDLTETKKQIGMGYILEPQQQKNEQDQKLSFEAMNRAKAQAEVDRQTEKDAGKFGGLGDIAGMVLGGVFNLGRTGAMAVSAHGTKDRADSSTQEAKDAERRHDEIKKTNELVADLLRQHVIKVRVMEPIPGGLGQPPSVSPDGRSPSPEQKARR